MSEVPPTPAPVLPWTTEAVSKRQYELEQEFFAIPCYDQHLWANTYEGLTPQGNSKPCGYCHICVTREAIRQDRAKRGGR